MEIKKIFKLVFSIIICQLAGIIGSFFTSSSVSTWYTTLKKPSFNPPNWVFGPVWITLFVLMGISLYLIWTKGIKTKKARIALILFGIQLLLNILWSIIFFGLKSPFYAFIEIIILWIAILLTIMRFYKISKTAAYLLIPYLLWVSFAAIVNFSIFYLNLNYGFFPI
jgi:tryptophan-rich sensory protein